MLDQNLKCLLAAGLFVAALGIPALAQEPATPEPAEKPIEKRLYKETGKTRHGRLEVQKGPAVPAEKRGEVDEASRVEVERFWDRLLNKTWRDTPPLPVPTREGAAWALSPPLSPPSELALSNQGLPTKAPNDFILVKNTMPSSVVPGGFSSIVNEPSVLAVDNTVFYTGNWYSALSSDGGDTFSFVNPFSGPFALPSGSSGFCCDQVTAYDPASKTSFYMQQYINSATTGVQRINVDQGADGTFDCFYDITPQVMGFAANNWADFPDLAVSDGFLYHSTNVFSTVGLGFTGAYVARYDLASLTQCSSVPFDVYTDMSFSSFKLTRGATDTMHFADHISTSSLRIWRWPDAAAMPTSFDRTITAWTNNVRTCPGPDARDWCGFIDRRLAAAYIADGVVGFMWVASQDGTFPMPHTRAAQFSSLTLSLVGEPIIWSGSIAWAYPSVSVNGNGDLGGTVLAGSSSLYMSCVAWLADDVNGGTIAPLENQVVRTGTSGPSTNRSGDYNSTSTAYPNGYLFAGSCFSYPSTGTADASYALFGREANQGIFTDGFESGNTSAW